MENKIKQLSEEEIINQVLQGRKELFGLLVRRYWRTSVALAFCRCGDSTAAEDLAQDSFVKAYTNLSGLRDGARFGGWLSKIVIQECYSYHRRKKQRREFSSLDPFPADQFVVCAARNNPGLTKKQVTFIHDCVRSLPEKLQKVVLMRFVGEFTIKQIAEQLGKKYGTVRVRLHRALKLLKEQLAPIFEEVQL